MTKQVRGNYDGRMYDVLGEYQHKGITYWVVNAPVGDHLILGNSSAFTPGHPFKVGDHVRIRNPLESLTWIYDKNPNITTGIVRAISGKQIGLEVIGLVGGHNLNGAAKDNRGWFFGDHQLELI